MFLTDLKNFYTKKIIKNNLVNVTPLGSVTKIEKIAVLIDESHKDYSEIILSKLLEKGYTKAQISVLIFKDKIAKGQEFNRSLIGYDDITWFSKCNSEKITNFVSEEYDLLINYYDEEKSPLLLVSHLSKAKLKAGFSSIDKRINHLMIGTTIQNETSFMEELFKYLKLLNQIE